MQARRTAIIDMPTSLRGIANRARKDRDARFRDLSGLLNKENLRWCFYQLRKKAASGVDGVTFVDYEQDLDQNLERLVERLKERGQPMNFRIQRKGSKGVSERGQSSHLSIDLDRKGVRGKGSVLAFKH